jgi:hypothetical protein
MPDISGNLCVGACDVGKQGVTEINHLTQSDIFCNTKSMWTDMSSHTDNIMSKTNNVTYIPEALG